MGALDSREKLNELYQPPADDFVLVNVPKLRYVMVDGAGRPDSERFSLAIRWLFAVVHPIKLLAKQHMGKNFVEPPLECLWWADDVQDLVDRNLDNLKWRLMIVATADWMEPEMFEQAIEQASKKLGNVPSGLRWDSYTEGKCVQILHVGPPGSQSQTVARLHNQFLPANKLVPHGFHHEIYLNDSRRVAQEKLKTVLRQPVRACRVKTVRSAPKR